MRMATATATASRVSSTVAISHPPALVPVDIEVSGLNDLRDYASLESYLESLTFISHVSVESLSGDTVRFRLSTRGGLDSLQRALSLNGRLQPAAAGENGIQRFQLHR